MDASSDEQFGISVELSGESLLVGADADHDAGLWSGSAYVYEQVAEGWLPPANLTASDAVMSDILGFSAASDGEFAVVSAPGADDADPTNNACNSGAVYVFQMPQEVSTYGFGCPCGNDDPPLRGAWL